VTLAKYDQVSCSAASWGRLGKIDVINAAWGRSMADERAPDCKAVPQFWQHHVGAVLDNQARDAVPAAPLAPGAGEPHDGGGVLGKGQ
jgi:hypothetical protein